MKILVTGGAGFIGSHLVDFLLTDPNVTLVRVMDNFATGFPHNLEAFHGHPKFEFMDGDIRNFGDCLKACSGIDRVSHQAALGSVPRSVADPLSTHNTNVNGFINMLEAARAEGIVRFVYASSSSVYGDNSDDMKLEPRVGNVLSPYAASKRANELYAEAYARNYGMSLVGLRYFNVFGPRQNTRGPYAAVIPVFVAAALAGSPPTIHGDGQNARDFTPVINVVHANVLAMFEPLQGGKLSICTHHVLNIACGRTTTLNTLWQWIRDIVGTPTVAVHGPPRHGDIANSLADISMAKQVLGYRPDSDFRRALVEVVDFYKD